MIAHPAQRRKRRGQAAMRGSARHAPAKLDSELTSATACASKPLAPGAPLCTAPATADPLDALLPRPLVMTEE